MLSKRMIVALVDSLMYVLKKLIVAAPAIASPSHGGYLRVAASLDWLKNPTGRCLGPRIAHNVPPIPCSDQSTVIAS